MPQRAPLFLRPSTGEINARIAQLVEQLAFNQLVLGSSPSPRTSPLIAAPFSAASALSATPTLQPENWGENVVAARDGTKSPQNPKEDPVYCSDRVGRSQPTSRIEAQLKHLNSIAGRACSGRPQFRPPEGGGRTLLEASAASSIPAKGNHKRFFPLIATIDPVRFLLMSSPSPPAGSDSIESRRAHALYPQLPCHHIP